MGKKCPLLQCCAVCRTVATLNSVIGVASQVFYSCMVTTERGDYCCILVEDISHCSIYQWTKLLDSYSNIVNIHKGTINMPSFLPGNYNVVL